MVQHHSHPFKMSIHILFFKVEHDFKCLVPWLPDALGNLATRHPSEGTVEHSRLACLTRKRGVHAQKAHVN